MLQRILPQLDLHRELGIPLRGPDGLDLRVVARQRVRVRRPHLGEGARRDRVDDAVVDLATDPVVFGQDGIGRGDGTVVDPEQAGEEVAGVDEAGCEADAGAVVGEGRLVGRVGWGKMVRKGEGGLTMGCKYGLRRRTA